LSIAERNNGGSGGYGAFLGEESLIRLGFGGVALQNICVFALGTRRLKTGGSQDWLSQFFDPVSNHSQLAPSESHRSIAFTSSAARVSDLN